MSLPKNPPSAKVVKFGAINSREEKYLERINAIATVKKAKEIELQKLREGYIKMQNKKLKIVSKLVSPANYTKAIEQGFTEC